MSSDNTKGYKRTRSGSPMRQETQPTPTRKEDRRLLCITFNPTTGNNYLWSHVIGTAAQTPEAATWAFTNFVTSLMLNILSKLCTYHDTMTPQEAGVLPTITCAYPYIRGHVINIFLSRELQDGEIAVITENTNTIIQDGQQLSIHTGYLADDGSPRDSPIYLRRTLHLDTEACSNMTERIFQRLFPPPFVYQEDKIAKQGWALCMKNIGDMHRIHPRSHRNVCHNVEEDPKQTNT